VDSKSEIFPQAFEAGNVCLSIVAEAEGLAFVDLESVQAIGEDALCELLGAPEAEVGVEGKNEREVEASLGEESEFFGQRGDEREPGTIVQDVGRVRIKSDCYGPCVDRFCPVDDRGDHHAVTAVYAVKIADCDDRWRDAGGEFGNGASDLQGFSIQGLGGSESRKFPRVQ